MSLKNRAIGLAVFGLGGLVIAPAAQASCKIPAAQVFAPWNDASYYFLTDAGDFERGAPGWRLAGGAKVVRDADDGLARDGAGDAYALELGRGASATSPAICVSTDSAFYRLFANGLASSARANLRVEVLKAGVVIKSDDLSAPAGRSVPSPKVAFVPGTVDTLLGMPVDMLGVTATVQIRVRSLNGASVRVDDVYMDPRMH